MADKRISQLVDRGTVVNNDVVPIVVSGAVTTNKATISSIQTFMQGNLDLGVTSVGITFGTSGTDINASGSPVTSSGNITINLPTASATNRGALSSADWITFNAKQPAGNYVTLDTVQTITAQKTFAGSGSSDTVIISHGSGSGFALDVIKAGNGETLRVTKTSGSGNAMTVIGGNFEAPTIVKTGGTSSQFLKADGSVDSSTYLTTGTASSTYVPYTGAAANVDLGVYNITSSAVNVNGSGSNAGVINLESNAIFPLVNGYGTIGSGTTNQFNFYQTTGAGVFRGAILSLNSIPDSVTRTYTLPNADGTLALSSDLGAYLPLAGGTLTGALNGTSASFTSGAINGTTDAFFDLNRNASGSAGRVRFQTAGTDEFEIGLKGGVAGFHITKGDATELVTVLTGGNVGIGTVSPGAKLTVEGTSNTAASRLVVTATGVASSFFGSASQGTVIGAESNISFRTGVNVITSGDTGTEIARVTANGLTFNGDTAAANALDDYEEGTFTPTATFTTPGSVSLSFAVGVYTKVGNLVSVMFRVNITKGTASGDIILAGLPFTSKNTTAYQASCAISTNSLIGTGVRFEALVDSNSTSISLQKITDATGSDSVVTAADLSATTSLRFQVNYQV